MNSAEKKQVKAAAKAVKKQAKAQVKAEQARAGGGTVIVEKAPKSSGAVRFAEYVRGILFLIFAVSLVIAIILSSQGYIVTINDIISSLIPLWFGKIILAVVAVAFFIYGLKYLRAIK